MAARSVPSRKGGESSVKCRNMNRQTGPVATATVQAVAHYDRSPVAKTYRHLFERVTTFEVLHDAYRMARRGKRGRDDVLLFERDLEGCLLELQAQLLRGDYHLGDYRRFYVREPKSRLVAALPFRDRIVQHALVAVIEPIWEARFFHHSYACRPGKGAHAAVDVVQGWMRVEQRAHPRIWALKLDVASYFASIDHAILMALLGRRIRCPRTLALCERILASWSPGVPIGNLTSQLFANIYLDALDRFVKQDLGVRRYARYMDDVVILYHDKSQLHALRKQIEHFLFEQLRLRTNNRTQVIPVGGPGTPGLDWLGYRLWTTHRRVRPASVRRMRRRLRWMTGAYSRGEIPLDAVTARIKSWVAHAARADTWRLRARLLGDFRL